MDLTNRASTFPAPRLGRVLLLLALIILAVAAVTIFAVGSRQRPLPPPFGPARNGVLVYASHGDVLSYDPATGILDRRDPGPRRTATRVCPPTGRGSCSIERSQGPSAISARSATSMGGTPFRLWPRSPTWTRSHGHPISEARLDELGCPLVERSGSPALMQPGTRHRAGRRIRTPGRRERPVASRRRWADLRGMAAGLHLWPVCRARRRDGRAPDRASHDG